MSTISSNNPTLMDVARSFGPDGKELIIAEILTDINPILEDMVFGECNSKMTNISAVRTGLPEATWRRLYQGVQPTKGTTAQVQDTCGMLETYSEVDAALANMAPNKAAFLLNEDRAHIAGMSNQMGTALFYGNKDTSPEKFEGLSSRYAAHSGTDRHKISYNVLSGGGSGSDNTSLWIIAWGANKIFGLYPEGSKAGLSSTDKGQVTVETSGGGRYEAFRTHYKWDMGLAVPDWRYAVRICNIDVSDLSGAGTSSYNGADLVNLLIDGLSRLPNDAKNVTIYGSRSVVTALNKLAVNKANMALSWEDYAGRKLSTFWGHPIKRVDAIIETEAAVASA